jgi:uncharacterized membrane protein YoaK (UPF0700 family)
MPPHPGAGEEVTLRFMNALSFHDRALAVGLAALAGFVDAIGFMELGGYFVSFMSGNSTRGAVLIADGSGDVWRPLAIVAAFVAGVVAGSVAGRLGGRYRRSAILGLAAASLALAAAGASGPALAAGALMASAMGATNAVFEHDGEVRFGVTYMTGALVRVGQGLAQALTGGPMLAWTMPFLLWLGLVGGAVLGATVHSLLQTAALWPAAAIYGLLAAGGAMLGRRD